MQLEAPAAIPSPEISADERSSNHLVSVQRCEHVSPQGKACGQIAGLRVVEGVVLCAWHDPARQAARKYKHAERNRAQGAAGATVKDGELPVSSIDSQEDAVKLAAWVPTAIATGRLGAKEATALVAALREWRMANADASLIARVAALEERIKAARARGLNV